MHAEQSDRDNQAEPDVEMTSLCPEQTDMSGNNNVVVTETQIDQINQIKNNSNANLYQMDVTKKCEID